MLKRIGVLVFITVALLLPLEAAYEHKEVLLRNGERVPEVILKTVMMNINLLLEKEPAVFLGLFEKAKNPDYGLSQSEEKTLIALGMLEGGEINNMVRSIVLSLVDGEGAERKLVNPVQPIKKDL